jgi:hypothetical protein
MTLDSHPEKGRRSARAAMSRPAARMLGTGRSPSHIPHSCRPSLSCRYSFDDVTAAHALALAATGMMMLIFQVAMPERAPFCVLVAFCSPFVLVLPLALQLGMPEWIFDIDVAICIAAAAFWFTIFLGILCFGNI